MNYEIQMPAIWKETSAGAIRKNLQDELLLHREVECIGQIEKDMAHALILQLRYLQKEDPKREITLYIDSRGGDVEAGLALYDAMQAISCPVNTICMGSAMSMAAVLFAAGKKRKMFPHARIMIHDPLLPPGFSGSALQIDSMSKDLMRWRDILAGILAEHTGKTKEEILKATAKDTYFTAEEAIEFGLSDSIIDKLEGGNENA